MSKQQNQELKNSLIKNSEESCDTYWVEGGLGKHVMFTAIIPQLAKKSKTNKINILSAYHDVFEYNPYVSHSWNIEDFYKHKSIISKKISKLHNYEPYKGTFATRNNIHLVQDWADNYGVQWNPDKDLPQLYLDKKLEKKSKKTAEKLGKYIIVQFTGGQPPINFDSEKPYQYNDLIIKRNYPYQMAQHFINLFRQDFPDYKIVDFSLPNEHYGFIGALRIPAPYLAFYEFAKHADLIVSIDSSLAHIAAAANRPGIVIWGGTRMEQFGWNIHTNVTNYNPETPFDENNPFYIGVDYYYLKELSKKMIKSS